MTNFKNKFIIKIMPHYLPITKTQNISIWGVARSFVLASKFVNNFLIIGVNNNNDSKYLDNIIYIKSNKNNLSHSNYILEDNNLISREEYINLVIKKIKEINPKLIEVENDPRLAGIIAKKTKIPLIFIPHVVIAKRNFLSRIIQYNRYIKHISELIFVSNSHKNHFKKNFFYSKIPYNVIHNSYGHINPTNIDFQNKKNQIIFAGRATKDKGYQEYILGVITVLQQYPNWTAIACLAVENSAIDKGLEEFLSQASIQIFIKNNQLKIYKNIQNKELFNLFESSKIAVSPTHMSWLEGIPLVGIEALAAKCAFIVSKNPGFIELCEKNALYLDSITPSEITKNLLFLIKNPENMKSFALSGYLHILTKYNIKDLVQIYDNVREKYLN